MSTRNPIQREVNELIEAHGANVILSAIASHFKESLANPIYQNECYKTERQCWMTIQTVVTQALRTCTILLQRFTTEGA